jgi:exopolysaccharide biosynthesis polyprenyl glycosylphosphotransferase
VAAAVAWALPGPVTASVVATGSALSLVGLVTVRVVYRAWLRNARGAGRFGRPIVLVGIDEQTPATRRQLEEHPEFGFMVVGAFGSQQAAQRCGMDDIWLGDIDHAPALVQCGTADAAAVSTTALSPDDLNSIVRDQLTGQCDVYLSAGISGVDQGRLRPGHIGYEPVVYIERHEPTWMQSTVKRALDVVLGSVALVLTLPVLAVGAVAIKLSDGGPVLFRQARVGRDGKLFTVYKLRTMTVDAEARLVHLSSHNERRGPLFKMEQDPRVTKVGGLIRELSLDELPQLWNVLRGEMSLVGPRPIVDAEVARYGDVYGLYTRIKPGISGFWQVSGRSDTGYENRVEMDAHYVRNWSLWLDLVILARTARCVLSSRGAY